MRIVDTKGQLCPAPIIAAKKVLKEIGVGELFMVLTDNQTSYNNLSRFFKDNNAQFIVTETEGTWTMTVTKIKGKAEITDAEAYCKPEIPHFNKGNFVVAFSSDKMGEGDDNLGFLLLSNFVKAIIDLDVLPARIVFYNKGVFLGTGDSEVIGHLREIEKMGVELFLCGTCISYYSLEEKIKIGSISNMFEIAQMMASASSVIKP
jgi:selenium metabolism protein YedF